MLKKMQELSVSELRQCYKETADYLRGRMTDSPKTAIILGSGLGRLAEEIQRDLEIPYSEIPHFPVSTVEGHSGKLIFGRLGNTSIMAMEGRFHFYEGYCMREVTYPVRIMYELGVENLFVSNAAGGVNPAFSIGDIMLISDHINFFPENPLRGQNVGPGPRFPSMDNAYDKEFIRMAKEIAEREGIKVHEGVYLGTQGPTFETPAEYRMFSAMGADTVGMSTVPEVIVAVHCGIRVFGISVVTDLGGFVEAQKVSHEDVLEAANSAQPKMTAIMKGIIAQL